MLGVAFVSGLGTLSSSLTDSIQDYYKEKKGLDLVIKSKSDTGFTSSKIDEIQKIVSVENIRKMTSIDIKDTRVVIFDMNQQPFHQMSIIEGREILNYGEILVDRTSDINISDNVTILGENFTVVGILENPSYYVYETEISIYEEDLNYIYYLDSNYYENLIKYITTDLYVKLDYSDSMNIFSSEYEEKTKDIALSIESKDDNFKVLTLQENLSYALTKNYGEKINLVAAVFPIFFISVA